MVKESGNLEDTLGMQYIKSKTLRVTRVYARRCPVVDGLAVDGQRSRGVGSVVIIALALPARRNASLTKRRAFIAFDPTTPRKHKNALVSFHIAVARCVLGVCSPASDAAGPRLGGPSSSPLGAAKGIFRRLHAACPQLHVKIDKFGARRLLNSIGMPRIDLCRKGGEAADRSAVSTQWHAANVALLTDQDLH